MKYYNGLMDFYRDHTLKAAPSRSELWLIPANTVTKARKRRSALERNFKGEVVKHRHIVLHKSPVKVVDDRAHGRRVYIDDNYTVIQSETGCLVFVFRHRSDVIHHFEVGILVSEGGTRTNVVGQL